MEVKQKITYPGLQVFLQGVGVNFFILSFSVNFPSARPA